MSQQLGDVLAGRNYSEPPEVRQIKEFVKAQINIVPGVSISNERYIIRVPSAAGAGVLRTKLAGLQQLLGNNKRIIIRIS